MSKVRPFCFLLFVFFSFESVQSISGGNYTQSGEFPVTTFHYIGPDEGDIVLCSATIIAPKWALTSGKCAERTNFDPTYLNLYTGITFPMNEGIKHSVSRIIPHPGYESTTKKNSLALLEVVEPFKEANNEIPLELSDEYVRAGEDFWTAGWSNSNYNRQLSLALRTTSMNDCYWRYEEEDLFGTIYTTDICGFPKGEQSNMDFIDQGCPLVSFDKKRLLGIRRMEVFTSQLDQTYVRIAPYLEWIESVINEQF